MRKFIKVYINSEMENEYKECADLYTDGIEKECNTCSCNGGDNIGCLIECKEYIEVDPSELRKIAIHYGYDKQSRQCIEECSELIQAINKYWRKFLQCGERTSFDFNDMVNNKEYENLVEEIADVEIMLAQLKMLLKCGNEVIKVSDLKIVRQIERMNSK
ncbi:hypothetical protein [Anaerosporobacter sp.]